MTPRDWIIVVLVAWTPVALLLAALMLDTWRRRRRRARRGGLLGQRRPPLSELRALAGEDDRRPVGW